MKTALVRFICRFLIVSFTAFSIGTANAGIVTVDQMAASGPASDRAVVLNFISRGEVASALQERGVDPQLARERVASMTDQEIAALKGRIDTLPAGAFLSQTEGVLVLLAIVGIIALIVWVIRGLLEK